MAGIYIHIPFCRSKCHYCNFFSMASLKYRDEFLKILGLEIGMRADYLAGEEVRSIYFGGGTPSLLSPGEISGIIAELGRYHQISGEAEITVEANPDDIDRDWARGIAEGPVNRISLGIQSFHDGDLRSLNRIHTALQAEQAIDLVLGAGIRNLSIDLIYGIPGLTTEMWEKNLEKFFSREIPHLSAYALTVEEHTALHHLIRKNKAPAPSEDAIVDHYRTLVALTAEKGFAHYEISNFALEGFYSQHNSLYWAGGHYLGLGPSAHSYNGISRRWNKPGMKVYLAMEQYFAETYEEEVPDKDQRYNEYVMTSLRTMWGCNLDIVRKEFGEDYAGHIIDEAQIFLEEGKMTLKNNILFLTPEGILFADGITASLFR